MNKNVKIKVEKALTEPVLEYIRKFSGLSLAERFTALGKDLLEYSKATKTEVDMTFEGFVKEEDVCLACLCGHAAYMANGSKEFEHWNPQQWNPLVVDPFADGKAIVDEILFNGKNTLSKFARKFPELWGNTAGEDAFRSAVAYNSSFDAIGIDIIAKHFIDVGGRIENG